MNRPQDPTEAEASKRKADKKGVHDLSFNGFSMHAADWITKVIRVLKNEDVERRHVTTNEIAEINREIKHLEERLSNLKKEKSSLQTDADVEEMKNLIRVLEYDLESVNGAGDKLTLKKAREVFAHIEQAKEAI